MIIWQEQRSYAIVTETEEERQLSDYELKLKYLNYLRSLRGKIFINKATKIYIEVNREIRGEIQSKIRVRRDKIKAIARIRILAIKLIPYCLIDSDPDILYEPDIKNRHDIEYSHVFKYKCVINGIEYIAKIRTRKKISQENRLYFIGLEDMELTEK
jgi:hypothetical protein